MSSERINEPSEHNEFDYLDLVESHILEVDHALAIVGVYLGRNLLDQSELMDIINGLLDRRNELEGEWGILNEIEEM